MPAAEAPSTPKGVLVRNRSLWLLVPTLSLLSGQAVAAAPVRLPLLLSCLLLVPVSFLFWREKRAWAFLVLLAGFGFSVGYMRHYRILHPAFGSNHVRSVMDEGSPLYLEGVLDAEPEKQPQRSRWVVYAERIWHPTGSQEISGYLLITLRHVQREWHYGDRIRLWVRPLIPRSAGNAGSFDYQSFLARREIYATGFLENDAGVELLGRGPSGPWNLIEHLRREIRHFMERHFALENGALMKALVVGDMGGISKEVRGKFTDAGVNHVLSISGLHVGMLGLVAFFVVRFAGSFSTFLLLRWNFLKVATFFSFVAVLFYTALAGGMVPTVRSAIMIGVYELAVLLDREEELFSSLALAALLIALVWPGVIMDISFQLSFLAVLFIIWGLRNLQVWWPGRRRDELPQERSWLSRKIRLAALYLAVPLLATIGTGPMIAYHFGHLSLAGFIANPLVVPLVGFIIVPLGLLIGFLSLVAPVLAPPFVWLAEPLLSLVHWMVGFISRLPLASIPVPIPSLMEVGMLYVLVLSLFLFRHKSHIIVAAGAISLILLGDGLYWWNERWNRKELRITHLSVGHGDAAVVEFPGSRVLLIDAGGTAAGEFDTGESIVAPFLRSRKILKVDYILVSHPRVDHYGGMSTIVEQFRPAEFWSGPAKADTARYQELEEVVEKSGIKRLILTSHDPCRAIEQVSLCVLYPPKARTVESSVVLRLSFGRVHFLFTGDIGKKEEWALLEQKLDLSSAILKVPRHGSQSSSSEEFVAAIRPRLAIFSVAGRNRFGLPRSEVLARYEAAGADILRTDQDGAITVETDGQSVRYWSHTSGKKGEFSPGINTPPGVGKSPPRS